jgi:hypothetical protein
LHEKHDFEALVIGSVAGLALTAGLLSFQVLTDRKQHEQKTEKRKLPVVLLLINTMKLYFMIYMQLHFEYLVTTSNHYQFV